MPRLHFVQELPVGSSKRDKELERAKARSHAASVSYQNHRQAPRLAAPQSHPQPWPPPHPERPQTLKEQRSDHASVGGGRRPSQFIARPDAIHIGPGPYWDDDGCGRSSSNPTLSFGQVQPQHGLQTPPQSPQERDLNTPTHTSLFQPWSTNPFAHPSSNQALTPPDSTWPGILWEGNSEDNHTEDVEEVNFNSNSSSLLDRLSSSSSSASSAALIFPQTRTPSRHHVVYQINPYAQTTAHMGPWATNINSPTTTPTTPACIPHDLLGTRADPFDCIPRRHAHSPSVNAVIDYHAQIMAPNHAPIYKIFNVTNVYTSYYFELLTHPDFLYTGVASVQAIIDHLSRRPDDASGPSENVLRHIGTAMVRLRRRLGRVQREMREQEAEEAEREREKETQRRRRRQREKRKDGHDVSVDIAPDNGHQRRDDEQEEDSPEPAAKDRSNNETLLVDDMTIMTVLFLAVVTRAINDLPSHEIHKRTIATLVAARGGLQNLHGHDGLARCTLMQWESFWALNTGSSIFPESRPAYQPVYPSVQILASSSSPLAQKVASLPLGFQALAHQRRLALDVLEVLSRTAEAHAEQMRHSTIVTPSDVFRTKPRRFQDFWEACTCLGAPDEVHTRLAEDGVTEEEMMVPNLEKMIVLALLLYCLHTFSPMRAVTAVYNGSRMKLTTDAPRRVRRTSHSTPMRAFTSRNPSSDKDAIAEIEIDIESEESVLLWIWFNLVDSWRAANDALLPQGLTLMRDLRRRFPEVTATWEGCEDGLRRFFWNEKFIRRCRGFWVVSESERMVMENG
ncbi:uncharacterized protein Z519_09266 [Cladophialophora bantiana CBS 173.52]|uniref:Transcription factor domain-containing protein n=1 Tax=Cladophialophora bantiana (strain ATCC 10958 / CBS 173.52 / CDC B-1940 / NIH 8579) TaxID=1442370 RepID=A0A0D2FTG1_CLAB1|nr:uncharacterized protein Z519_09266 [Cladophialophora bantiana CBS 173.52]KIW89837.1 hypothetical protein Z519_09266 [Cladophialophora bantiana CBS 173.52]